MMRRTVPLLAVILLAVTAPVAAQQRGNGGGGDGDQDSARAELQAGRNLPIREIERRWLGQEAPALIVDSNGIVLLASPPDWRYATLQAQSQETLERISREQFAGQPVGIEPHGRRDDRADKRPPPGLVKPGDAEVPEGGGGDFMGEVRCGHDARGLRQRTAAGKRR